MGYLSAMGMAASADLPVALRWHLVSNHYPPADPAWIPCCQWVIERAKAGEDLEVMAPVPEGYPPMLASKIFRDLHLEPFTYDYEEEDES